MTCNDCEARARMMRRDLLNAHMTGAAKHAVKGMAEMLGLSEKTALAEAAAHEVATETDAKPKKTKADG